MTPSTGAAAPEEAGGAPSAAPSRADVPPARHCTSMAEVRAAVDELDDLLVPLLARRVGYMSQAARIKPHAGQVRDEARIEQIAARVRARAAAHGGEVQVIEAIYRAMMEACIAFEAREFERLRAAPQPSHPTPPEAA